MSRRGSGPGRLDLAGHLTESGGCCPATVRSRAIRSRLAARDASLETATAVRIASGASLGVIYFAASLLLAERWILWAGTRMAGCSR
jgi:hypothetical protein